MPPCYLHSLRFAKWLFFRLRFTFMSLFFTLTYLILAFLVIVEIIYNDVFPTFSLTCFQHLLPGKWMAHAFDDQSKWKSTKQVPLEQAASKAWKIALHFDLDPFVTGITVRDYKTAFVTSYGNLLFLFFTKEVADRQQKRRDRAFPCFVVSQSNVLR